jgi:hypothetical protein
MQSLVATRSELLDRRRRAVFVSQGRDLLKDKRTALVREFGRHQSELLKGMERLRSRSVDARRCLDEGVAVCGPEPLASGALSAATGISARLTTRAVVASGSSSSVTIGSAVTRAAAAGLPRWLRFTSTVSPRPTRSCWTRSWTCVRSS